MSLNLKALLVGSPVRLRYVFRFSTSRVQHPETVAEHSYYVALYSLMIGRSVQDRIPLNMERLLCRSIIHDMEESRSGDFPRPFKHSDDDLRQMLEDASLKAIKQVASELFDESGPCATIVKTWRDSKDDSYEGRILEFADFLSVLSFMYEEIGAGGNRSIENHVREMTAYFEKFEEKEFDFLGNLRDQARELMLEVFPRKGAASA